MAQQRVSLISNHLSGTPSYLAKRDSDVVIVAAKRSPLTRAFKGPLAQLQQEEILSAVLRGTLASGGVDPSLIEDVCMGTVLPPKGGATICRLAQLHAGIPKDATTVTVNRQCSSGLQAIAIIANMISAGQIDIGIGGGAESMSNHYVASTLPPDQKVSEIVLGNKEAADCLMSNGDTSENVSSDYGQKREDLDRFAARSYQRAGEAQRKGYFVEEIIPITVNKDGQRIQVTADDGIRPGTTAEVLGRLKPVFSPTGLSTAGNSSQLTDGAAAVILARRDVARKYNLPILGKYVTIQTAGVPARIMGVGPGYAIPKLLKKVNISKDAVDFFEINEAFASQVVWCIKHLGLNEDKVNPNGGAIALGHPLGATGARQVVTALSHAKRTGARTFVVSMCCGTGIGVAALFVNEQS